MRAARAAALRAADASRDARHFHRAAEQYGAFIRTWGESFAILVQWGNMLKDSGAYEQAENAYRRALLLVPDDADCHLQLGHLMKLTGRLDRAEKFYKEAHRADPDQVHAAFELQEMEDRRARERGPYPAVPGPLACRDCGTRMTVARERLMVNLVWRRS